MAASPASGVDGSNWRAVCHAMSQFQPRQPATAMASMTTRARSAVFCLVPGAGGSRRVSTALWRSRNSGMRVTVCDRPRCEAVYSDLLRYRLLLRRFPKARGPSRSHRTELLRRRMSGRENGVGAVRSGHWEGSRATGTIESLKKTKKVKYCAPIVTNKS